MNAKELIERYQAGERDFYGVDLSGVDFDELNPNLDNIIKLSGANFTDANFSNANFSYVSFTGTNFSNANLTGAKLTYVFISGSTIFEKV